MKLQRLSYLLPWYPPTLSLKLAVVTYFSSFHQYGFARLDDDTSCYFNLKSRRYLSFGSSGFEVELLSPGIRGDKVWMAICRFPLPVVGETIVLSTKLSEKGFWADNWASTGSWAKQVEEYLAPRKFRVWFGLCQDNKPIGKQKMQWFGYITDLPTNLQRPKSVSSYKDDILYDGIAKGIQSAKHRWEVELPNGTWIPAADPRPYR